MKRCDIEAKCPYSINCQHKEVAGYCAHHRMHDPSFPLKSVVCPTHPSCYYAFVCDMSMSMQHCKKRSTPPVAPDPVPQQFNPYAAKVDDAVFYLPKA